MCKKRLVLQWFTSVFKNLKPPLRVEMSISTLQVDPHWWPYLLVLKPTGLTQTET